MSAKGQKRTLDDVTEATPRELLTPALMRLFQIRFSCPQQRTVLSRLEKLASITVAPTILPRDADGAEFSAGTSGSSSAAINFQRVILIYRQGEVMRAGYSSSHNLSSSCIVALICRPSSESGSTS